MPRRGRVGGGLGDPSRSGLPASRAGGPGAGLCLVRSRACGAGLPEVTVSVCILNIFSCICAAGTWPVRCVCGSYLVGCVMCGGVAKGSGTVDVFQHNHMHPPATLPRPRPCPVPSHRKARELLGSEEDPRPLLWPRILGDGEVSGAGSRFGLRPQCQADLLQARPVRVGWAAALDALPVVPGNSLRGGRLQTRRGGAGSPAS